MNLTTRNFFRYAAFLLIIWPLILIVVEFWPTGFPWHLALAGISLTIGVTLMIYHFLRSRQKEVEIEASIARLTATDYMALDTRLEEVIKHIETLQNSTSSEDTTELRKYIKNSLYGINRGSLPLTTIDYTSVKLDSRTENEALLTNLRLNREKIKTLLLEAKDMAAAPELEQRNTTQNSSIQLINRLKVEVNNLNARAKLYLFIGSSITISAGVLLTFFLIFSRGDIVALSQKGEVTNMQLIQAYLPRISIVIFIEFFALYFFKLHKENANRVQYFHNELTNVEMQLIALASALGFKDQVQLTDLLKPLIQTERNFKLAKGETTTDIEREKLTRDDFLKIVSQLLDKKKSKSKKD